MTSARPTPFLEANALLAAQENDRNSVFEILREMLPGELRSLASACRRLDAWAALEIEDRT